MDGNDAAAAAGAPGRDDGRDEMSFLGLSVSRGDGNEQEGNEAKEEEQGPHADKDIPADVDKRDQGGGFARIIDKREAEDALVTRRSIGIDITGGEIAKGPPMVLIVQEGDDPEPNKR